MIISLLILYKYNGGRDMSIIIIHPAGDCVVALTGILIVCLKIHTYLVSGRPGAVNHSTTLQEFTQARYVRLRFQGLRRSGEAFADKRRAFYSIKEINIGGQCLCSGHASRCQYSVHHRVSVNEYIVYNIQ